VALALVSDLYRENSFGDAYRLGDPKVCFAVPLGDKTNSTEVVSS
jgi:hypothetical protein